jgi:hypothetical protein
MFASVAGQEEAGAFALFHKRRRPLATIAMTTTPEGGGFIPENFLACAEAVYPGSFAPTL